MWGVLAFWLALLVPGLAVVRLYFAEDRESGVMGQIALGYLASFALLSPLSIVAYALHAPLWLLSAGYVASVLIGTVALVRKESLTWPAIEVAGLLAALIVIADVVASCRVGSALAGDAVFHIARVRMLVDHGFNNWDPYIAGHHFSRVYHTNLYHALLAVCAQLTGLLPLEVWSFTLGWAGLVMAAGVYYLVWTVFGERWIAWPAAVYSMLWRAPVTFNLYPNKVAPYWLGMLAIAFLVQSLARSNARVSLKFGAVFLVLAQVHGLYAAFAALLVVPGLAVGFLWACLRRQPRAARFARFALATAVAAPLILVARYGSAAAPPVQSPPLAAAVAQAGQSAPTDNTLRADDAAGRVKKHKKKKNKRNKRSSDYWYLDDGRYALDGSNYLDPKTSAPYMLLVVFAAGCFSRRRREVCALLASIAVLGVVVHVPQVFSLATEFSGAPWVTARFGLFRLILAQALWPFILLVWSLPLGALPWMRIALLCWAVFHAHTTGIDSKDWSRALFIERALDTARHERRLDLARKEVRKLAQHLPRGATVVARPRAANRLVMLYDCHVIATQPGRGSPGLPGMAERRADLAALLASSSRQERLKLLGKYDARYLYYLSKVRRLNALYGDLTLASHLTAQGRLLRLDVPPR